VEIGFLHRAAGQAGSGRGGRLAGGCGLDVAVLAILALAVRFGAQVDPLLVAMVAQDQRLAAVGDENEGVMGNRHDGFLPAGPTPRLSIWFPYPSQAAIVVR